MTRLNLMAGGPTAQLPADWMAVPGDWVGIDRGTLRLIDAGIQPLFCVGDFDSLTSDEFIRVQSAVPDFKRYPPEKDYTDTQLALKRALTLTPKTTLFLYGATGGRLDHALANLYLPLTPGLTALTSRLVLIDNQNRVLYLGAGKRVFHPLTDYRYFGVVSLTPVKGLTIAGAKYPLNDWSSTAPFSWASNEFLQEDDISVQLDAGMVALIYSRDRVGQTQYN